MYNHAVTSLSSGSMGNKKEDGCLGQTPPDKNHFHSGICRGSSALLIDIDPECWELQGRHSFLKGGHFFCLKYLNVLLTVALQKKIPMGQEKYEVKITTKTPQAICRTLQLCLTDSTVVEYKVLNLIGMEFLLVYVFVSCRNKLSVFCVHLSVS